MFTNALLFGGSNSCSSTSTTTLETCASGISDGLMGLLGNNFDIGGNIDYTYAWFLSDNGVEQEAGYLEYLFYLFQPGSSRVSKINDYRSISIIDQSHTITGGGTNYGTWMLYKQVSVPEVTTTGSMAALASVFALMALLCERRGGSRRERTA